MLHHAQQLHEKKLNVEGVISMKENKTFILNLSLMTINFYLYTLITVALQMFYVIWDLTLCHPANGSAIFEINQCLPVGGFRNPQRINLFLDYLTTLSVIQI
jgi:hypothetical protein